MAPMCSAIGEEGKEEFSSFTPRVETENSILILITGNLAGQDLLMVIDTGATPNCIALRCVSASDIF